jgi:hypothetical protein
MRWRRCRSALACSAKPHSGTGWPRRTAVITSCSGLRERACRCTSPAATTATPVASPTSCSVCSSQVVVAGQQQFGGDPGVTCPNFCTAPTCTRSRDFGRAPARAPADEQDLAFVQQRKVARLPRTDVLALLASRRASVMNSHRLPQPVMLRASATRRKPSSANSDPSSSLSPQLLRLAVRPHHAGHRTFVGERQRRIAEVRARAAPAPAGARRRAGKLKLERQCSSRTPAARPCGSFRRTGRAGTSGRGPGRPRAARGRSTAGRPTRCGQMK